MSAEGDAAAIIEAAKAFGQGELVTVDDAQFMSVPGGRKLQSIKPFIDEFAAAPDRKKGTAVLANLESFCAHVNRFKDADSVVFADVDTPKPELVAVLDYHKAGEGGPRFGHHRSAYRFPVAPEWEAWNGVSGTSLSLGPFAEFLEERILDVLDPLAAGVATVDMAKALGITLATPQKILTLSRGLSVHVNSRVTNARNLSSGEGTMAFETSHEDETGAPLAIPGGFAIAIPVFKNQPLYKLSVRLRYRVSAGAVTWTMMLQRPDLAVQDAVAEALAKVAKETGLAVLSGRPE